MEDQEETQLIRQYIRTLYVCIRYITNKDLNIPVCEKT